MLERLLSILRDLLAGSALTSENLANILISLFLSIIVSFIVSQIYKQTHYGMNYEQSFMIALVLLGPIVASVMLFIQGSLAISLALVGSLSIIRFRTPIKDSLDMIFIFWVCAVGIGSGTYNWTIVVIMSALLTIAISILQFVKYGHSHNRYFVLALSGNASYPVTEVEQVIKKYTSDARIRSHEAENQYWEVVFEVRFVNPAGTETRGFVQELQSLGNIQKVSLLAPQLALPV